MDSSRRGFLDVWQLQRALAAGDLNFSLTTVAQMVKMHDADAKGSLNEQEFTALHKFLLNIQDAFQFYDTQRSGVLLQDQLSAAVLRAGFQLQPKAFETVFSTFDPDNRGQLGLDQFIALTIFLEGTRRVFAAFDPEQAGHIALDYNQFVYASAKTR
eukprot:CAMPEP_0197865604 /NCGR_PEP_ID=MMETSP1438-20131217/43762_1 /TAXON_ID=1461541 /ORGANISM="Pterosperma sp., Strain CCMP1384" /LENGTH=156 /DNA_ID=CAMNT_0043484093 /DNA_START=393 /DNA_END=863 /DNA_ORIENTATION=-